MVKLEASTVSDKDLLSKHIMELMNYHRRLNNAPKKYWCTLLEAQNTFLNWVNSGDLFKIVNDNNLLGFLYVKHLSTSVSVLEDFYLKSEFRGQGFGKVAMNQLDRLLESKNVSSLLVDVQPKNKMALDLYVELGFDHLNMIQLRKNYDTRLNKEEKVSIVSHDLKMY